MDINEYAVKLGRDYFGPFLLGFTRWLKKSIDSKNINKVFFFSRDGYMMAKSFEILNDDAGYGYECEYVYFSRSSIRHALLWRSNTYEDSIKYLTQERLVSLGKLLKYYGLSENIQQEICKKYNVELTDTYRLEQISNDNQLKTIYTDYKALINDNSLKQAELLRCYIKQIGMVGECAIVDIGWHGSMQYYLEQFFEYEQIKVKFTGFYVGINPTTEIKGDVYGYIFYPGNLKYRKNVLCFLGGYEKLFQSLEGSTVGYEYRHDKVVPKMEDYEYGDDLKAIISLWQESAIEYIKTNSHSMFDNKHLSKKLIKFGMNPPMWGIELFKDFSLNDGQIQFFVSPKSILKYNIKELTNYLGSSVWKTGFLKSLFKVPAPYFIIYKLLRK